MATKDMIVTEKEQSYSITIPKKDAKAKELIMELQNDSIQQNSLAALIGCSQGTISNKKNTNM